MTIKITCYGETQNFKSRAAALKYYKNCERNSEGSERERYTSIIWQLEDGRTECLDVDPDYMY